MLICLSLSVPVPTPSFLSKREEASTAATTRHARLLLHPPSAREDAANFAHAADEDLLSFSRKLF